MSVSTLYFETSDFPSAPEAIIKPIAMPAAGVFSGPPASNIDMIEAQIVACEDEPFEDMISETTRIVYGNSSFVGINRSIDFRARFPCPISRRPGPRKLPVSPTENGGKL